MMREHAWHQRYPFNEQKQIYQNLVDLHLITESWIKSEDSIGMSYRIPPFEDSPLEDQWPEEFLVHVFNKVWGAQASFLAKNINSLQSFRSSCFKLGVECAQRRWPLQTKAGQQSLVSIYHSLFNSPLSGFPYRLGFLPRRLTAQEVQIELHACPHQLPLLPEVGKVADPLCDLHGEWIKGFVIALNSGIQFEQVAHQTKNSKTNQRCIQIWHLNHENKENKE